MVVADVVKGNSYQLYARLYNRICVQISKGRVEVMTTAERRDKFRRWIRDTTTENLLWLEEESSDTLIDESFDDALEEANYLIPPILQTVWTFTSFPSAMILNYGVLTHILIGATAHSARNQTQYNDSGGVAVGGVYDQWSRYLNLLPAVQRKWENSIKSLKVNQNFSNCWGSVPSEYGIYS